MKPCSVCGSEETLSYENVERARVWLCEQHGKAFNRYQDKDDVIDKYFEKGDKRRGEALVVLAQSYIDGQRDLRLVLREILGKPNAYEILKDALKREDNK